MTRRGVLACAGIALAAVMGLLASSVVPSTIESRINTVRGRPNPAPRAVRLHSSLLIADLHADTLLWGRDLLKRSGRGHVDVPRLIEGNVALQAFMVVTKAPKNINMMRNSDASDMVLPLILAQRWPPLTWRSMKERALYQARRFERAASDSKGQLTWIKSANGLNAYLQRRGVNARLTAGFLGIEGAQALDGDIANLAPLFDAGFRMMSLTHFTDNSYAGSSTGVRKGGLTAEGRALIREMESRRMIVDLAHASPRTVNDILSIATRPVLVSHTGVQATCPSNRNLSDAQLKRIAAAGGLIGIAYFQGATCGADAKAVVRAIRRTANLVGIDHVALGSDFDGGVRMPFDAAGLAEITEALLSAGYSQTEIAKIMGGNTLRFLERNLP